MAGEWVRSGGKAGEPIEFEAEGHVESLRRRKRVAQRVASGTGAVAVFVSPAGEHTIGWIIKGGLLKPSTVGLLVPGGIRSVGTHKNGAAVVVYVTEDGPGAEEHELWFKGVRSAGFTTAVTRAAERERAKMVSQTIVPAALALLSGAYFLNCLGAGQIPPPGYAFLNRFLHGIPMEWQEEFAAQQSAMANGADLRHSVTGLGEALDRVEHEGAPVPILQALEEAVTLNLTGVVALTAHDLLSADPTLRGHAVLAGGPVCGWSLDAEVDRLALLIRDEASSVDAQISFQAKAWASRPGECFRCCVELIAVIGERIGARGVRELDQLLEEEKQLDSMDVGIQRQARRMIMAGDLIKQRS